MGNNTAKENFEDFVIQYKNYNEMKLLPLYDYYDPHGVGKIPKSSFARILDECLLIYKEKMTKEVAAHPKLYSTDGMKLLAKKLEDSNFQTSILKEFPDEVGFEEFRKYLEKFFDENLKFIIKKKKSRTSSFENGGGDMFKIQQQPETTKRGSVILEFGKSIQNSFAKRGSIIGIQNRSKSDPTVRKSFIGTMFQEKEEIYNFYDFKKEDVFTKNEKLPRYHFIGEPLLTTDEKVTAMYCLGSLLYIGTQTGQIICYEISEVQSDKSVSLIKKEISRLQTKEKLPIVKIDVDEPCSLLFYLSNDCITIVHYKTFVLKDGINEDENNKGAYSFVEKGIISGGLRSGNLTMFSLDATRNEEDGTHRIAVFGIKSKNIDVYEYATPKLKLIPNLILVGREEYLINTIGEEVTIVNSKSSWPKAKDKMKNPDVVYIASRVNHKNSYTVLVKSHHYVMPAFLQVTSGNKIVPYVENNKTHYDAKYSDMKFTHEPEEMAVCFPFVAGSIDSSKGPTKCIEFKNVFNPRTTSTKDRNFYKSIRDPTPIRLDGKCTFLVASKERFYYCVGENKIFYVAVPSIISQLDHLKEDELFSRYQKLKVVRASAINQIFRVDLIKVMNRSTETGKIPMKIQELVDFLLIHAPDVKGIFRVPGTKAEVDKVIDLIDLGEPVPYDKYVKDVNDVASAFKQYIRELPIPILTYEKFDSFLLVSNIESNEEKLEVLSKLIADIPKPNQYLLYELLKLCRKIEEKATFNLMTSENLAVVFGIGVLKPEDEMKQLMCVNGIQSVFKTMMELFPKFFVTILDDETVGTSQPEENKEVPPTEIVQVISEAKVETLTEVVKEVTVESDDMTEVKPMIEESLVPQSQTSEVSEIDASTENKQEVIEPKVEIPSEPLVDNSISHEFNAAPSDSVITEPSATWGKSVEEKVDDSVATVENIPEVQPDVNVIEETVEKIESSNIEQNLIGTETLEKAGNDITMDSQLPLKEDAQIIELTEQTIEVVEIYSSNEKVESIETIVATEETHLQITAPLASNESDIAVQQENTTIEPEILLQ